MSLLSGWWKERTKRERNLIGGAGIIIAVYVLVSYVIFPISDAFHQNKKELESQRALLKRYQRLIGTLEKARVKMGKEQAMKKGIDAVLLKGATPDLASAELQGLIKSLAQKSNITFKQIKPQKTIETDDFIEIGLSIPFKGSIKQIENFLYDLETAEQFIKVKELKIKKGRRSKRKLRVDMKVAAFIRNPSKPKQKEKEQQDSDRS